MVQRFSSTLQSFVHFHVVVPDGVFTRDAKGGEVVFHEGRAPSCDDVAKVAARVAERMRRWLRRKKLLDERPAEDRSNEAPERSPLEACVQASLFAGDFHARGARGAAGVAVAGRGRRGPRAHADEEEEPVER